ncbi:GNAT family N-acetyltransferase [Nakamurella flavida]|uniref:GNAT family N-acetyltransferase n=1 Tax=Nakamurella flavida TaxID=363630 RepID=A0A939C1J6_9ACTN|nr:GNAT family N-acetyltransferase [Nakamurella flavida]MBM9475051.1 GNAT family N-acetyltransferase [Nakamurella flavida]MDP9776619.1 GNAT superfamily N-acetyltransferase [Nakamurella flavida]
MALATVRAAGRADAVALSDLQIEIWRTAFADLLPAALLSGLAADPSPHRQAWRDKIDAGDVVLLALEGATPVGLATGRTDPADPDTGEIEVLGVLPRWGRRGHGGRLLAETGRLLAGRGAVRGRWWIPARDVVSATFLAAAGWTADGTTRALDADGRPLVEVRYGGGLAFTVW